MHTSIKRIALALVVITTVMSLGWSLGVQTANAQSAPSGRTPYAPVPFAPLDESAVLPAVVGGTSATLGEFPYQVTVFPGPYLCGGSLVDRQWVVTAAHCLFDDYGNVFAPASVSVILGNLSLYNADAGQVTKSIAQVVVHPGYNPAIYDNDIALLKLSSAVTPTATYAPVSLLRSPRHDAYAVPGSMATVSGWGTTSYGGSIAAVLQKASVPIVSNTSCNLAYGDITANMICAGYEAGGVDSCQGDSGGPLVVYDAVGKPLLAGVVSSGYGCGYAGYPGIYTRVSQYVNWIEGYTNPTAAVLALTPVTATIAPGERITVTVEVRPGSEVDAAAAAIDFNPAVLDVVEIIPGATLPSVIQNTYTNTLGQIDYAAGILTGTLPSTNFVLAKVVLEGQAPGVATLLFTQTVGSGGIARVSDVTLAGNSVLGSFSDSRITVEPARLVGTVALPGRGAGPAVSKQVPVTVTLATLAGTRILTESVTLDAAGRFTLSNLSVGTRLVTVKGANTLSDQVEVKIVAGATGAAFTLRGGDADGNDVVELADFGVMVPTFARCSTAAGYDARADFNNDRCVVLVDFSILRTGFGQTGDAAARALLAPARTGSPARLEWGALPAAAAVGDRITLEVWVESGGPVDGAAAALRLDPRIFRIVGVSAGTTLPVVLDATVDAEAGSVGFAAGTFDALPTGRFVLARVEVEAVGPGVSPLAFVDDRSGSDVTLDGGSVLGTAVDTELRVTGEARAGSFLYLPALDR